MSFFDTLPGLSFAKLIVYSIVLTFIMWLGYTFAGLQGYDTVYDLVKRLGHLALFLLFIWGFFLPAEQKETRLISFSKGSHIW